MYHFQKCPSEDLDFIVDFSLVEDDSIQNAVWDIPADLQIISIHKDFERATIYLSEGIPWNKYLCSVLITTTARRAIRVNFEIQLVKRHHAEDRVMKYDHKTRQMIHVQPRDLNQEEADYDDMSEINPRKMTIIPQHEELEDNDYNNTRTMGV